MNKISPKDVGRLISLSQDAAMALVDLNKLYASINDQAAELVAAYEEAREEARGILEDAANEAESYYDEKSEKWQEGDRGSAYYEWVQTLRQLADGMAEELELPDTPEVDTPDWVDECSECNFSEFEG